MSPTARALLAWMLCVALAGALGARGGELAVFDARDAARGDVLMLACLQGVANRDAPRLCLAFREADRQWAALTARVFGLTVVEVGDREALLRRCRPLLQGVAVWDPAAPHTANLAATLAGLEDLLVVEPGRLSVAEELGLACRHDLRGRFAGRDAAAVYAWAAEHLAPRCDRSLVGRVGVSAPPPVEADVGRFLAERGELFLRLTDAMPEDGAPGARLRRLRLEWDVAGTRRAIAFRAGSDGERPYLLDPDGSRLDARGDRAADGQADMLYRFLLRPGASARLRLDVHGQVRVLAAGRPAGPAEELACWREGRPWPAHEVRDLLVARRALVFDLRAETPFGRRVLKDGPPNLSLHCHLAAHILKDTPGAERAVPFSTHAAADLSHRNGAALSDPAATSPRVWVARPGKDEPEGHVVYGPYETVPPGRYAVAWRLQAAGELADRPLATLDVFDVRDRGRVYARRTLAATALAPAGRYRWVVLPIQVEAPARLEYRVQWHGGAELRVDRIVAWRL